jgi:hypothetical protein
MSATWQLRDGSTIPVEAMTAEHLLNAFRMVSRQGKDCPALRKEIARRMAGGNRKPTLEPVDCTWMSDVLDDCAIGGCDRYGSLE